MQKKKTYSPDALRSLSVLEGRLDYRFRDIYLLASALTHSSWANEHNTQHNERLDLLYLNRIGNTDYTAHLH